MTTPSTALTSVPSTHPISINSDPTKTAKPPRSRTSACILAGSIAALLAGPAAHAATRNWDGDTSVAWATAANWNTLPVNDLTTDIASFNLAAYGGNPVFSPDAGTTSVNGIAVGASNGAMTLTTTNLSIGGSGINITNGAGAFTVAGALTLGAAQSWLNNSANPFSTGAVTNGADLLTIGGTGNTTINGVIGSGSGGLTKTDSGVLTLSGANAYTGPTTVNAGTLNIQNNTALGTAAGGTTVATGSKLQLQNNITVTGEALTLNGGVLVVATGGTATTSGAYEIRTFTSNGTLTVSDGGSLDYLVVGGGGGGGGQSGGGGGGGEFRTGSLSVTPNEVFTVTRGAGGGVNGSAPAFNNRGSTGGTSSLISGSNSVSAFGGGGGGGANNNLGLGGVGTGSAGGNGWLFQNPPFPPGVAGGNGGSGGRYGGGDLAGGGGGGAGGNGGNGSGGTVGGNGGVGLSSSISGVLTYYAGGGGGATQNNLTSGLGGLGGGGRGGYAWGSNPAVQGATAGAPNTGGGGGGADDGPGIGGSGIVIVRYISSAALENVSGNNEWKGAITLGTDVAIASLAGELTLSGTITGGFGITKIGAGTLTFGPAIGGGSLAGVGDLTTQAGTTNVNSVLGGGTSDVSVTGATTKLRFGTASQTLGSLTIGAGSTVVFTSGAASGSFSGDEKGAGFAGAAAVPEPGTLGLLLLGALGAMNRRRRQA